MAGDIARYRLYFQQPTEEVRQRYDDAISFLKLVANNKAHLQIQDAVINQIVDDQPKNKPSTCQWYQLQGCVFGDSTLSMMPSIK